MQIFSTISNIFCFAKCGILSLSTPSPDPKFPEATGSGSHPYTVDEYGPATFSRVSGDLEQCAK
jgi:hypothetical protein